MFENRGQARRKSHLNLSPTNRERVFVFNPPLKAFDPLTAGHRVLREQGIFLRRPDPAREPTLYKPWKRIVSMLGEPSVYSDPPKCVPRVMGEPLPWKIVGHKNSTWAGSQVGGRWVGAFATWHVPSISIPSALNWSAGPQELRSSSWVGLSGVGQGQAVAILQSGVDHIIDVTGKVSYAPWIEWYPNDSIYFDLSVSAGDQIAVAIQLVSTNTENVGNPDPPAGPYNYGGINFVNVPTGKALTFYLMPPPPPTPPLNEQFVELNAEWILEWMTSFLPKSTPIEFETCGACNVGGTVVGKPSEGTVFNLLINDVPQSATTVSDTTVTITDLEP